MSEPVRQLDVPLRGKRPANPPIPGSTRDRVQQQANRMLPGIVDDNGGKGLEPRKPRPVRGAWGEVASSLGFALALSLRSKAFKWTVRVMSLVLWFVLPVTLSGLLTLVMLAWCVVGVGGWVKRAARKGKGVDTCKCHC